MQKLRLATEDRKTEEKQIPYTLVKMAGLIDAPNFAMFEANLEKLLRADKVRVVLDFRQIQYINSTGISSVIRFHTAMAERGGCLLLTQVSRNVGLTMHLLGVTSIVPFLKDLADAEGYLDEGRSAADPESFHESSDAAPKEIPVLAHEDAREAGSVIVVVPQEGPFTRILRSRLGRLNGNYHLLHDIGDLHRSLDKWEPDLIVVDHRLGGVDEFIESLKVDPRFSLTSVIVLYEKGLDVERSRDFRVWENDYLVDPFELMNLFVLTESELKRVPRDRKLLTQQVRFQFQSKPEAVARGLKLANRLIQGLGLSDTDNTALYAAMKEGVDNAVLHGNRHGSDKSVSVNFLVDPAKVTILVEDQGEGFDYEYFLSQIDNEEAFERAKQRIRAGGRGGLGILLMHKCSDRLEYSGQGNVLRIEKNISRD